MTLRALQGLTRLARATARRAPDVPHASLLAVLGRASRVPVTRTFGTNDSKSLARGISHGR
jgi:hypothetical protein